MPSAVVGLHDPKGSGTSGYVVRNRGGYQSGIYQKVPEIYNEFATTTISPVHIPIVSKAERLMDRRHKVRSECFDLRQKLTKEKKLTPEEIEEIVSKKQEEGLAEVEATIDEKREDDREGPIGFGKMARLRKALTGSDAIRQLGEHDNPFEIIRDEEQARKDKKANQLREELDTLIGANLKLKQMARIKAKKIMKMNSGIMTLIKTRIKKDWTDSEDSTSSDSSSSGKSTKKQREKKPTKLIQGRKLMEKRRLQDTCSVSMSDVSDTVGNQYESYDTDTFGTTEALLASPPSDAFAHSQLAEYLVPGLYASFLLLFLNKFHVCQKRVHGRQNPLLHE